MSKLRQFQSIETDLIVTHKNDLTESDDEMELQNCGDIDVLVS